MKLFKEILNGTHSSSTPPMLLAPGDIAGGKNIRRASSEGGWEPRYGSTKINTAEAESGAVVKSIHEYLNPKQGDYHVITQINGKLLEMSTGYETLLTEGGETLLTESGEELLAPTGGDPLESRPNLGTTLGVTVGAEPGFSAIIGENFIYADGSGPPVIWGGSSPFCIGFVVYDDSEAAYIDYTKRVTDGRTSTYATLGASANDKYYVITELPASAIHLTFGSTVNDNAVTLAVKAWRAGSFTAVSNTVDGTASTQTHDTDGSISWTASTADKMRVLAGIPGFVYEVSFSGALDGVLVTSCKVTQAAATIQNKWDGVFSFVDGALYYDYDGTNPIYVDVIGKLSDDTESTYLDLSSAPTGDFLYLKTLQPAIGFGIGVVSGSDNTDAATIDEIAPWTGNAWTAVTTNIVDETKNPAGTKSLSKTGTVWFDAANVSPVPQKRTFQGDPVPGYWYRLSWSAAFSADTKIYSAVYAAYPEELGTYDGVFEFNGALFMWGDKEYPNRLRYSPFDRPSVLNGAASGYTDPVGDASKILSAIQLYDYAIIFKANGVWAIDKELTISRIAAHTGIASPKSAQTIEIGIAGMKRDELVSVCMWQALDGVYMYDAAKPKKISGPVSKYFDPQSSDVIDEAHIRACGSLNDPTTNEYHLLIPDGRELVYNYDDDLWYPVWERDTRLTCGLLARKTAGRYAILGGTPTGFLLNLEDGTTDCGTAFTKELLTRSICAVPDKSSTYRFTLRDITLEMSTQTSGSVSVSLYLNHSTLAAVTKSVSLIDNNKAYHNAGYGFSRPNVEAFQLFFSSEDWFTLWSLLYELEAAGELFLS